MSSSDFRPTVGDWVRYSGQDWFVEEITSSRGLVMITNSFDTRVVPVTSLKKAKQA